jgi:hypothetical protein
MKNKTVFFDLEETIKSMIKFLNIIFILFFSLCLSGCKKEISPKEQSNTDFSELMRLHKIQLNFLDTIKSAPKNCQKLNPAIDYQVSVDAAYEALLKTAPYYPKIQAEKSLSVYKDHAEHPHIIQGVSCEQYDAAQKAYQKTTNLFINKLSEINRKIYVDKISK